ncbi:hypothetical protein V8C37DRAFT_161663 [Trichoderma ceciliae]
MLLLLLLLLLQVPVPSYNALPPMQIPSFKTPFILLFSMLYSSTIQVCSTQLRRPSKPSRSWSKYVLFHPLRLSTVIQTRK